MTCLLFYHNVGEICPCSHLYQNAKIPASLSSTHLFFIRGLISCIICCISQISKWFSGSYIDYNFTLKKKPLRLSGSFHYKKKTVPTTEICWSGRLDLIYHRHSLLHLSLTVTSFLEYLTLSSVCESKKFSALYLVFTSIHGRPTKCLTLFHCRLL